MRAGYYRTHAARAADAAVKNIVADARRVHPARACRRIPLTYIINALSSQGESSCQFQKTQPGGGRRRGALSHAAVRGDASSHREAPNIARYADAGFDRLLPVQQLRSPAATVTSRCSPTTSRCRRRTAGLTISRWIRPALYEIHIDNDGDARENLTFQFRFTNRLANDNRGIKLNIGGAEGRGAAQEHGWRQRGRQLRRSISARATR